MCKDENEIYTLIDFLKTIANIPLIVHGGLDKRSLLGMILLTRRGGKSKQVLGYTYFYL